MKRNYYTLAFLVAISLQFACAFQPTYIPVSAAKRENGHALFTADFVRHNIDSWVPMSAESKPR